MKKVSKILEMLTNISLFAMYIIFKNYMTGFLFVLLSIVGIGSIVLFAVSLLTIIFWNKDKKINKLELQQLLEIERQAFKNLKELYDIDTKSLLQQNSKHKKVIEILKGRGLTLYYGQHLRMPFISLKDCGDGVCVSVEEADLLSEVLERD